MKYLQPSLMLPGGVRASQVRTVEAAQNAVGSLREQIASIEHQLRAGQPPNPEPDFDRRVWEIRTRDALKAKRHMVEEIVGAIELVREMRRRQLVEMRLARQDHARKMVRIERSRHQTEADMQRFKQAVKSILPPEQYDAIWADLRGGPSACEPTDFADGGRPHA